MSDKIENIKDSGSLKLIFGWLYRYWGSHRLKLLVLLVLTMPAGLMGTLAPLVARRRPEPG